jgi:hypothetical protein
MKEKLTLSINKKTITLSKRLAKKKGISLSRLVEDYLNESVADLEVQNNDKNVILDQLLGCISLDESKDYKSLIEEARVDNAETNKSTHRL